MFEHKSSIVSLHCEIDPSEGKEERVHVMWLYSDTIIRPSALVEIIEPVCHLENFLYTLNLLYALMYA